MIVGRLKKTFLMTVISAFLITCYGNITFGATVEPYCTKSVQKAISINVGSHEDANLNGTIFKSQNSVKGFEVKYKAPSFIVPDKKSLNAFNRIQAEDLTFNNGLEIEDCPDENGTKNLAYIGNGDFAGYENVFFPKGVKGFKGRVSSDTEGGFIELRIDSPQGEVIGKCKVERTGGWANYTDVYCQLEQNVVGYHNLFLGFVGERDGLFNVNWFQFTKNAYDPIKLKDYSDNSSGILKYEDIDFGNSKERSKFVVQISKSNRGTLDICVDNTSNVVGILEINNAINTPTYVECELSTNINGVKDVYLVDKNSLTKSIDTFWFESVEESGGQGGFSNLTDTNVEGYNLEISVPVSKNSVYEVYLYTEDKNKENRQVYDIKLNGTYADTVDFQKENNNFLKKGPYLAKVMSDGKLVISCESKRSKVSVSGIEINKVTYSKAFNDVKMDQWFYIPVMELASQGVIFGKGNDTFKPGDHIIGEHVAYMMFNVMKVAVGEMDNTFDPEEYRKLSDISPDFWAYHYLSAYYNYFYKEKMLRYDVNTKVNYSAKEYETKRKVRREEFAMAMVGTKRLDYNEKGRVFVMDPDLEPGASLNRFKKKDASQVSDSFRYFVELSLEKGLMKGDNLGNLNPKDPVTRGEAAAFIYNALNLKENNFVQPKKDEMLPVPRITAKKRNVNVGILVLPAPAWDSIYSKDVNDSNPDFTLLELLDRNINKPMDWVLTNPYPPKFDKNEYKNIMHLNSADLPGGDNASFSAFSSKFKDLRSVARAQKDLECDITYTGAVGYTENIQKSKFFKYWEVTLDDPSYTPQKIAKDYDILFQTSHGKITYSQDVQNKVKAFLNAGGQLWWENCLGLEIKPGDGFTDEVVFKSINKGNNYKLPQIPQVDTNGSLHPLLDNIYTIDSEDTTRVWAPGLLNKNSEVSMLGDGEEWLNDDNRCIESYLPTDQVVLNVQDTNGQKYPNMIVRDIINQDEPAGRIVITTNDIGCGITKFVNRSGGKAVEDYKFCYNLFGWMSKVDVSFDETCGKTWDGKDTFSIKATVVNQGAKTQTYDLTPSYDKNKWNLMKTEEYKNFKNKISPVQSLDSNGYPAKITLEPNQSEEIEYHLKLNNLDNPWYAFGLKANESAVKVSRDTDEVSFVLYNIRIKEPLLSQKAVNGNYQNIDATIFAPDKIEDEVKPIDYELNLTFMNNGRLINPESVFKGVQIQKTPDTPEYKELKYDYSYDDKGNLFVKVIVENVIYSKKSESIKFNISVDKSSNKGLEIIGKVQAFDPISRARLAFSTDASIKIK